MSENVAQNSIRIGDREIELNAEVYRIIQEHYKYGDTLDKLADQLGLEGWEQAYQLISALPQWAIWFTQAQFEEKLKLERKAHPSPRRHTRRKKPETEKAKAEESGSDSPSPPAEEQHN
ncbi:MAG: hypothetical protein QXI37_03895 [Thermoprotei archaeon]